MAKQTFSYHTTLHYWEDNEWLSNPIISKAKKLWLKSSKSPDDADVKKACNILKPHIEAAFDREKIVDKIADIIAPVDEDGWRESDNTSLIYGLRKSIFSPIDIDSYEQETVDALDVVNIQFYSLNDDDELDESKQSNAMTITLVATKTLQVKKELKSIDEFEAWSEKFDLDLSDAFTVELGRSITSYIDEDGDEMSSYSNATLDEGYLMAPSGMPPAELRELARQYALNGDIETVHVSDNSKLILNAIGDGNIPAVMKLLQAKNVDQPLILGVETSAVLPLLFSSLLVGKVELEESLNALDESLKFQFPEQAIIIELIYALTSMGANLQYKIGESVGYLEIAIMASEELTNFLLSFGLDALGSDADALLMAVEAGKVDLIDSFLASGADVNHKTEDGTTALLLASQGRGPSNQLSSDDSACYIKIIDLLVSSGGDINVIDDGGDSVLSNAARVNSVEICVHLINLGASLNPQSDSLNVLSPLGVAEGKGYKDLSEYLRGQGALNIIQTPKPKAKAKPKEKAKVKVKAKAKAKAKPKVKGINSAIGSREITAADHTKLLQESKLTAKIPCIGCGKAFTVKTLKSREGRCNACYKKSYGETPPKVIKPKPKRSKKNPVSSPKKANLTKKRSVIGSFFEGVGSFFEGLFDLLDALVELIKGLLIIGFALTIIGLIVAAIFTG